MGNKTDYCSEIVIQWYRALIRVLGAIETYNFVTGPGLYYVSVSVYPACDVHSAQILFYETEAYIFSGLWVLVDSK